MSTTQKKLQTTMFLYHDHFFQSIRLKPTNILNEFYYLEMYDASVDRASVPKKEKKTKISKFQPFDLL